MFYGRAVFIRLCGPYVILSRVTVDRIQTLTDKKGKQGFITVQQRRGQKASLGHSQKSPENHRNDHNTKQPKQKG